MTGIQCSAHNLSVDTSIGSGASLFVMTDTCSLMCSDSYIADVTVPILIQECNMNNSYVLSFYLLIALSIIVFDKSCDNVHI